jgi:hypothetical protein
MATFTRRRDESRSGGRAIGGQESSSTQGQAPDSLSLSLSLDSNWTHPGRLGFQIRPNLLLLRHGPSHLGTRRVIPPVLSMWLSIWKLDEEKSKHARLAKQNGFGPKFGEAGKCIAKPNREEECTKCDMIAAPHFWLANHNGSWRWFPINSLFPICSLSF